MNGIVRVGLRVPAMTRFLGSLACGMLLLTQTVWAAIAESDAAFEAFKNLKGRWAIQSGGKTITTVMTYDVGSKDSIVTEQFGKELSVIYRDGQDLRMTHFCNAGNQPRLKLKQSRSPGLFEFEVFDITNLKSPNEPHVQKIVYRVVDAKHLELEIVWKKGDSEEPEKYALTRILSG
jgi:hypothetical protein